jgi:hypothetical protein
LNLSAFNAATSSTQIEDTTNPTSLLSTQGSIKEDKNKEKLDFSFEHD